MTTIDGDLVIQGAEHQAYYKHFIAPPSAIPNHAIEVQLASYPPLAQVTTIPIGNLTFTTTITGIRPTWEVVLWSNLHPNEEWQDTPMRAITPNNGPVTLRDNSNGMTIFSVAIKVEKSFNFTFKYRAGLEEPWKWVQAETGLGDGTVLVTRPRASDIPRNLSDVIRGLNPALSVHPRVSQSPGATVWTLQASIPGVESGGEAELIATPVGIPWGTYIRWFGLARAWEPWLCPVHGRDKFDTDKSVILSSFLSETGVSVVFLAISGISDTNAFIKPDDDGRVTLYARNDSDRNQNATLIIAACHHVENAIAAAVYEARTLKPYNALSETLDEAPPPTTTEKASSDDTKAMWYENWYDGLGYCTWNALGQKLTDQKIYNALDELAAANIKISTLIIDDNWQSIEVTGEGQTQYPMTRFEALSEAFPDGLKKTVANIKSKHQTIRYIAVWHALFGYWGGVSPTGKIGQTYETVPVTRRSNMGGPMHAVSAASIRHFYNDFYSFLSSCGIDGVKTDAQYVLDTFESTETRRSLTKAYQDAWTMASLQHFGNKVISCMSQVPQILFHSQMPQDRPAVVVRNSDDFFPHAPASHPWHVWANAYNALFSRHLNLVPDWDMFQTVHDYSGFHAAARCVSGGPVYITDEPGKYDVELIREMTGETVKGKTVILRPSSVARAADPYVGYHDDVLLKVIGYHGGSSGYPIMGIFNISSRPLSELLPLTSFSGITPDTSHRYIIRAHTTGAISDIQSPGSPSSLLSITLPMRGFEILTAYELSVYKNKQQDEVSVAALGLLGKMTGAAAIVGNMVGLCDNGRLLIDVFVKALGTLGIFISSLPNLTINDHLLVTMMGQVIPPHTISINPTNPRILDIDVDAAWKELELRSGWANEVQIKVYITIG